MTMGDGSRVMRLELTDAQYDVLMAALDEIIGRWDQASEDWSRDVGTVLRARGRIVEAWMEGTRK